MPRPVPRFRKFIGHKKLIDPLRREQAGATTRREPLLHILLTGPSGIGKTHLAEALSEEGGTRLRRVMGDAPRNDLIKELTSLEFGDFLFVDEAHSMKPHEQELLFMAIDRLRVPRLDEDTSSKKEDKEPKEIPLQPFTLILATDRPNLLPNALKKRFPRRLHLPRYRIKEMKEIVATVASEIKILLSAQATQRLAAVCHGIPRVAKHYLQRLRQFFPEEKHQLSIGDVEEFFRKNQIDKHGLESTERRYLRFLGKNDKASLETLALYLDMDRDHVLRQIEPTLVRKGLIDITSSGRKLTAKGKERFGSKDGKTAREKS